MEDLKRQLINERSLRAAVESNLRDMRKENQRLHGLFNTHSFYIIRIPKRINKASVQLQLQKIKSGFKMVWMTLKDLFWPNDVSEHDS